MSTVAQRYAKALFLAATEAKNLTEVATVATELAPAITSDVRAFLANPLLADEVKFKALSAALTKAKPSKSAGKTLTQFFAVMAENNRLAELAPTLKAFINQVNAASGRVVAEVKTASALSAAQKKEIAAWVKANDKAVKDVEIDEQLDTSVIAGLEVRVGSKLYDATVAGRLARLKTNLNVSN